MDGKVEVKRTHYSCPDCGDTLVLVSMDEELSEMAGQVNMEFMPLVCPQPKCRIEFVHLFTVKEDAGGV